MSDTAKTKLLHIPLALIHEPDESLRKVDSETEDFLSLVDSIRADGVMNPINVREFTDPETGDTMYGLIDGLQRLTASKYAGLEDIPAQVLNIEDGQVLEAQIIANAHKIETKPVEYSKALLKVLQANPMMTRAELAGSLSKTSGWISERLGLLKLANQVGDLVDEGTIGLSNAYQLAKLPEQEQVAHIDRAISMTPPQFATTVGARAKELRDAKRQGRTAGEAVFEPIAVLKSRKDILEELETRQLGEGLLVQSGIEDDALAGFYEGLKFALTLDPVGVSQQKAKEDERKAALEIRREENKLKRQEKRAKEAADKAARIQEEYKEDAEVYKKTGKMPVHEKPTNKQKEEADKGEAAVTEEIGGA